MDERQSQSAAEIGQMGLGPDEDPHTSGVHEGKPGEIQPQVSMAVGDQCIKDGVKVRRCRDIKVAEEDGLGVAVEMLQRNGELFRT